MKLHELLLYGENHQYGGWEEDQEEEGINKEICYAKTSCDHRSSLQDALDEILDQYDYLIRLVDSMCHTDPGNELDDWTPKEATRKAKMLSAFRRDMKNSLNSYVAKLMLALTTNP